MGNDEQDTTRSCEASGSRISVGTTCAPALLLLLFVSPALGQAEDFVYTTNNSEITIVGYTSWRGGAVTIPATINGLPVTSIGDFAFWIHTNLTSIVMPNSITSIGHGAFSSCVSLANLTLGNSVASIADDAFYYCGRLTNITIPAGVTYIGSAAFYACSSLTNVTIPSGVTNLSDQLFQDCISLTSVTIPDSVATIGSAAFNFCKSLTNILIPKSVTEIEMGAFYACLGMKAICFQGDAPILGSAVFDGGNNATVYYLPGTSGWGPTFGSRPTAVWQPRIQISDDSFGVRTNQFGFNIAWAEGMTVVVEASTNLANPVWSPLHTNTLTSDPLYFSDPQWTNYPVRFYRLRWP